MVLTSSTVRTEALIREGILAIGDGYRARNSELGKSGLPFARAGNIDGGFSFENADRLAVADLHKVGEKRSRVGDVVFTSKGTVGRFALVTRDTPEFVFSPQLCFWRSLQPARLLPRFLYYWMHGDEFWTQVEGLKGQTDMADYVNLADQRRMHITIPQIDQQRSIAAILGALDDKIDLNRQMNRTLEEMASALFKSWFIDFDPVVAKAAGRQPFGMDAATAALFPAGFEETAEGAVPGGWKASRLRDFLYINPKRTLSPKLPAPYLEMANAPTVGHAPSKVGLREPISGVRFTNGDTLLAKITPCLENGKAGFVDFLADGQVGWGSTEFIVMRPKPPIPLPFAYLLARHSDFKEHAIQSMTGSSGRQRVDLDSLCRWTLVLPSNPKIFDAFGDAVQPWFALAGANAKESQTLAVLRDLLLPQLLSGEMRVKDAEKLVEAAV